MSLRDYAKSVEQSYAPKSGLRAYAAKLEGNATPSPTPTPTYDAENRKLDALASAMVGANKSVEAMPVVEKPKPNTDVVTKILDSRRGKVGVEQFLEENRRKNNEEINKTLHPNSSARASASSRLAAAEEAYSGIRGIADEALRAEIETEYANAIDNYKRVYGKSPYRETFGEVADAFGKAAVNAIPYAIDWADATVSKAATGLASGITGTVDALVSPFIRAAGSAVGQDWSNNPISQANEVASGWDEASSQRINEFAKGDPVLSGITNLGASGLQMLLPYGVAKVFTAIANTPAALQTISSLANAPKTAQMANTVLQMVKNPNYITAFVQEAGNNYNEAKSWAKNDNVASAYALTVGALNAGLEVGLDNKSGIQGMEDNLINGDGSLFRNWLNTATDETVEELTQGVTSRAASGAFGKDIPIFSFSEEAVFNPETMVKEASAGFVLSAILSAGNIVSSDALLAPDQQTSSAPSQTTPSPATPILAPETSVNTTAEQNGVQGVVEPLNEDVLTRVLTGETAQNDAPTEVTPAVNETPTETAPAITETPAEFTSSVVKTPAELAAEAEYAPTEIAPPTEGGDGLGAMNRQFPIVMAETQINALRNVLTDEELAMVGLTPENLEHEVISFAERAKTANDRLDADFDGEIEYLLETKDWSSSDAATAFQALLRFKDEAMATGDYSGYAELADAIKAHGSKAGSVLNVYAQYANNPDRMVMDAATQLFTGANPETVKLIEQQRDEALNILRTLHEEYLKEAERDTSAGWVEQLSKDFAKKIGRNRITSGERTTYQTILSDLTKFAAGLVHKNSSAASPRTAVDMVVDYLNNRAEYNRAWEGAKALVEERYANNEDALAKFKNWVKENGTAGADKIMLKAVAEVVAAEEISKKALGVRGALDADAFAAEISESVLNEITQRANVDEVALSAIDNAVRQYVSDHAYDSEKIDSRINTDIRKSLKEIGEKMSDIIKQGDTNKAEVASKISQMLVKDYGISANEAGEVAGRVVEQFNKMVAENSQKALEKMLGDKANPAQKKHNQKLFDKLANMGAFSNPEFAAKALWKLVGADPHRVLTTEQANEVVRNISDLTSAYKAAVETQNVKTLVNIIESAAKVRGTDSYNNDGLSKEIQWALNHVAKQGDFDFLKDHAIRSIVGIYSDFVNPATAMDKAAAYRRMAMLSKVTTTMRNLVGNEVFDGLDTLSRDISVPLDIAISHYTGTRSISVDKGVLSPEKLKGAVDALAKSVVEVGLDITSDETNGRMETSGGRTHKMVGSPVEKLMSTFEKYLGYALVSTDQFKKGGITAEVKRGLNELAAQGKIKGLSADQAMQVEELVDELAMNEALYRTFQDDNAVSEAVVKFKQALNNIKDADGNSLHIGDLVAPFVKTPVNISLRTAGYSPIGLTKSMVDLARVFVDAKRGTLTVAQQAKAVQGVGRGVTGSTLMLMAAYGALKGAIKILHTGGSGKDDKDRTAFEKTKGQKKVQVNFSLIKRLLLGDDSGKTRKDDVVVDFSGIDQLGAIFNTGTLIAEDLENDGSISLKDVLALPAEGVVKTLAERPLTSVITNAASAYKYANKDEDGDGIDDNKLAPFEAALGSVLGDVASSAVPNIIKGVAKGTDPYERDVSSKGTVIGKAWDEFKLGVPGLRKTLPEKLDSFGNKVVNNEDPLLHFLNNNVFPLGVTSYDSTEVTDFIDEVAETTGATDVYPTSTAPKKMSNDGVEYKLSYDERKLYRQTQGYETDQLIRALMDKGFTAQENAKIIPKIKEVAAEIAKDEYLAGEGVEYDMSSTAENALASGDPVDFLANYVKYSAYPVNIMDGSHWGKTQEMLDAGLTLDEYSEMANYFSALKKEREAKNTPDKGAAIMQAMLSPTSNNDSNKKGKSESTSIKKADVEKYCREHFGSRWLKIAKAYRN